jgi:hypothetical protein
MAGHTHHDDPTDLRPLKHYYTPKFCLYNIMVYVVWGLMGWAYYVFVVLVCFGLLKERLAQSIAYLLVFHALFILTNLSYIRTIFSDPGSVPPGCDVVRGVFDFFCSVFFAAWSSFKTQMLE